MTTEQYSGTKGEKIFGKWYGSNGDQISFNGKTVMTGKVQLIDWERT